MSHSQSLLRCSTILSSLYTCAQYPKRHPILTKSLIWKHIHQMCMLVFKNCFTTHFTTYIYPHLNVNGGNGCITSNRDPKHGVFSQKKIGFLHWCSPFVQAGFSQIHPCLGCQHIYHSDSHFAFLLNFEFHSYDEIPSFQGSLEEPLASSH